MIKAVIFDVDGTLVDSVDLHARAWQDAFRDFGHALEFDSIRGQIGKGGDQLMPEFLSKEELDVKGAELEHHRASVLKDRYLEKVKGFPEVRSLFLRLQKDGIQTILASSAKAGELSFYKKRADIDDIVDKETSSDDAKHSKPHADIFEAAIARLRDIKRDEILVVGDTPYDAEAAKKAGLRTIGVLCGGFPDESLRTAGCIAIFRDPADILSRYDQLPLS